MVGEGLHWADVRRPDTSSQQGDSGLQKDAQDYAQDIETKRDLGTLEKPVTAARNPSDGLTNLIRMCLGVCRKKSDFSV